MSTTGIHRLWVNVLTFSRVPLIAAFAVAAVYAQLKACSLWAWVAAVLMFLAGISDLFDGMLARKWHVVTTFGKLADPLMDKIFFIVSFPTLLWLIGVQGENGVHAIMMLVFTILYIVRDQWVTFLRSVVSVYGVDVGAMWLGKVRTALSFPAAGIIYLYLAFHAALPAAWNGPMLVCMYVIEGALIALNAWSCIAYTRVYMPYLKRACGNEK